jgi:hypothetical protein
MAPPVHTETANRSASWNPKSRLKARLSTAASDDALGIPSPRSTPTNDIKRVSSGPAWDDLEAELEKRMDFSLKDSNKQKSGAPVEKKQVKIVKKSPNLLAYKQECNLDPVSKAVGEGKAIIDDLAAGNRRKPALSKSEKSNSESSFGWSKTRFWVRQQGSGLSKKSSIVEKECNKTDQDSKSTTSSSSSQLAANTPLESKSTKGFWGLKLGTFRKKEQKPTPQAITIQIVPVGPSKDQLLPPKDPKVKSVRAKAWLQKVGQVKNQVWLEQVRMAIDEAKVEATKSMVRQDDELGFLCDDSEISEPGSDWSEYDDEYDYPRTDTRVVKYDYMAQHDAAMADDEMSVSSMELLFDCLTCSEIMTDATDMRRFDPRGMTVEPRGNGTYERKKFNTKLVLMHVILGQLYSLSLSLSFRFTSIL